MNRFYMQARTMVLRTKLGKALRKSMQMRSYKEEDAERIAQETYGEKMSQSEIKNIAKDMMKEAKTFNVAFDEYIMYHFESKDDF